VGLRLVVDFCLDIISNLRNTRAEIPPAASHQLSKPAPAQVVDSEQRLRQGLLTIALSSTGRK